MAQPVPFALVSREASTRPAGAFRNPKLSDYDLIEARYTISKLQTALDRATARVRELQTTVGALNERMAIGDEQIEGLVLDLSMERLRGEIAAEWDDARATADMAKST